MAVANRYPGLAYVQAEDFGGLRPGTLWLVHHTMEVSESSTAAEGTANYFARGSGGRTVSSHTCVDNNSGVQCVPRLNRAYCAGNRTGNDYGIHIEQAGTARQSSADWQDAYSQALLRRVAAIHARDIVDFAIPIRWLTVAQVQARWKGLCTHNDLRLAFNVTTHWDPGPAYPKAQMVELYKQEVAKLVSTPTAPTYASVTVKVPVLRVGDKSSMVARAQLMLNYVDSSLADLTVDGVYGAKTKAKVEAVLRRVGWPGDGNAIDAREWKLLNNVW